MTSSNISKSSSDIKVVNLFDQQPEIAESMDWFSEIATAYRFDPVTVGRRATIAVTEQSDGSVPVVRTTNQYTSAPQKCNEPLEMLREMISNIAENEFDIPPEQTEFNDIMLQLYDSRYRRMGYHTDQMIDLKTSSYIAVCSIYSDPETVELRTLKIKDKLTGQAVRDITMTHGSIVLFSLQANRDHLHKIILDRYEKKSSQPSQPSQSDLTQCLSITMRTSNRFLSFDEDNIPRLLPDSTELRLATDDERKQFYNLKQQENKDPEFEWPTDIDFTISESDLMEPTKPNDIKTSSGINVYEFELDCDCDISEDTNDKAELEYQIRKTKLAKARIMEQHLNSHTWM